MIFIKFHSSTRSKRNDSFTNIEYLKCYSNKDSNCSSELYSFLFLSRLQLLNFLYQYNTRGKKRTNCSYTDSIAR